MESLGGKRLLQQAVKVGEALPISVYASNGMLLLGRGHYVLTDAQRVRLLSLGGPGNAAPQPAPVEVGAQYTRREINPFEELLHKARSLDALLARPLQTPTLESKVRQLADAVADLADFMPDAMIAALLLAPTVRYTSTHSIHTAILLALLSRRLALPASTRQSLLAAALTMNIAVPQLMDALHQQPDPLSPLQRAEMDIHPILGSAILREAGIEDALWHELVQHHHERWDGSGYPQQLTRPAIPPLAHLLHLADLASAKLSSRSYRSALVPQQALRQVFEYREKQLDAQHVALLVKELGIYPPGSFVRLANGEIGVVVQRRDKATEPFVAALRREDGPPYAAPLLRETRLSQYAVSCAVAASAAGVRTAYLAPLWRKVREG